MGYLRDLRHRLFGQETETDRLSRENAEQLSELNERLNTLTTMDAELNKSLDETDAIFKSVIESKHTGG
jgi:hypothetical protein